MCVAADQRPITRLEKTPSTPQSHDGEFARIIKNRVWKPFVSSRVIFVMPRNEALYEAFFFLPHEVETTTLSQPNYGRRFIADNWNVGKMNGFCFINSATLCGTVSVRSYSFIIPIHGRKSEYFSVQPRRLIQMRSAQVWKMHKRGDFRFIMSGKHFCNVRKKMCFSSSFF